MILAEEKYLKRWKLHKDPRWLNQTISGKNFCLYGAATPTLETKQLLSQRTKESWLNPNSRLRQRKVVVHYTALRRDWVAWGESKPLGEWLELYPHVSLHQFQNRIVMGWTVERALETIPRKRSPNKEK